MHCQAPESNLAPPPTVVTRARVLLVGLGRVGCGYDANLPFVPDQPRSSARIVTHARAIACHPAFTFEAGVDPCPEARKRRDQAVCDGDEPGDALRGQG